ncbi:hypothetical protein CcaverHIS002_0502400 [Cutaneotrichosporon cavernicola]|uniref:Uncharacterized protein n=1 Tax=Cutaneotrichosporon cavernicola TaxID=279322 RepID=A0AA48QWS5_9TREE|nr:uncharacterized protein CcaverHIS019_0502980 [Cutaneotrichosporon cavernicola]BEJ15788.1 hypothetical protein CspHIS471_0503930 [Cutaneotrichosporon sp. HIS471]BEI84839.1 hypothetical protein CcaverHIS002_0502400 [Cutaneotrichosporon cavernicola]BEI92670.1 hypothetical protein CcaverHIS019_0502980 [Cutaneotrichosporon cavernicola]BEJ00445.1 hypothetical protein CcaverHIS631_0503020 [Cutaneotrichosporon cavernicola]BEJ08214.1 hypothetical protein CcaverHIS641_0502990 [Cutaneotrichosporon cav
MSTSTTKARHYNALGGRIRALNSTMAETDQLMGQLSEYLLHMQQFAACHAAQFMATSALLDVEINTANAAAEEREADRSTDTERG